MAELIENKKNSDINAGLKLQYEKLKNIHEISKAVSSVLDIAERYSVKTIYVGGGGYKNKTLMDLLDKELPGFDIRDVNLNGIKISCI